MTQSEKQDHLDQLEAELDRSHERGRSLIEDIIRLASAEVDPVSEHPLMGQ